MLRCVCVCVCKKHTPIRFVLYSLKKTEEKRSKFVKMFSLKIEAYILEHLS